MSVAGDIAFIKAELENLDIPTPTVDLTQINSKLDGIDGKVSSVGNAVYTVDTKVSPLANKLDVIEGKVEGVAGTQNTHGGWIQKIFSDITNPGYGLAAIGGLTFGVKGRVDEVTRTLQAVNFQAMIGGITQLLAAMGGVVSVLNFLQSLSLGKQLEALEAEVVTSREIVVGKVIAEGERTRSSTNARLDRIEKLSGDSVNAALDAKAQSVQANINIRENTAKVNDNINISRDIKGTVTANASAIASVNTKVSGLNGAIASVDSKVSSLGGTLSGLDTKVSGIDGKVSGLGSSLTSINGKVDLTNSKIDSLGGQLTTINGQFAPVNAKLTDIQTKIAGLQLPTSGLATSSQVTAIDTKLTSYQQAIANQQATINRIPTILSTNLTNITNVTNTIPAQVNQTNQQFERTVTAKLNELTGLAKLNPLLTTAATTTALTPKLEQLNRNDLEAKTKLDELTGLTKQTPLLTTAATVAAITPLIQGATQQLKLEIPNAVDAKFCRGSTGCGGQLARTVSANNNALDLVNAGMNGVQLPLLNQINTKLGPELTSGGISGFLKRLWNNSFVEKAMGAMTLMATIHNAIMISNSIGQTLLSALDYGLQTIGIKDADGSPVDVRKVVSGFVDSALVAAFGYDTVVGMKTEWLKYNRIYQSASNVLWTMQSLSGSILGALEIVGSQNAKVANALRIYAVVGEKAYEFFNPQPNFNNRFLLGLEKAQSAAYSLEIVSGNILSTTQSVQQLNTDIGNLQKAAKGQDTDGKPLVATLNLEHDPTAQQQGQIKLNSQVPDINLNGIFSPRI